MFNSTSVLVLGDSVGVAMQLCDYLQGQEIEYRVLTTSATSSTPISVSSDSVVPAPHFIKDPISASVAGADGNFDASMAVAFVCVGTNNSAEYLSHVADLSKRGIPVIGVLERGSAAIAPAVRSAGAFEVLNAPLKPLLIEDALDTALYRREIERHQTSMEDHAKQLSTLTPRERRIVQMAADGAPNKQIARTVGLSVKSIERIRRDAYRKLNVRSTAEMTRVVLLGSLFEYVGSTFRSSALVPANMLG